MKFSNQYTKLSDRLFTTIRDHSFYNEGEVIPCRTPVETFRARVLLKVPRRFNSMPECFLQYDTDSPEKSKEEIIEDIRGLYARGPPGPNDVMTIYLLEKLRP